MHNRNSICLHMPSCSYIAVYINAHSTGDAVTFTYLGGYPTIRIRLFKRNSQHSPIPCPHSVTARPKTTHVIKFTKHYRGYLPAKERLSSGCSESGVSAHGYGVCSGLSCSDGAAELHGSRHHWKLLRLLDRSKSDMWQRCVQRIC